ncbi:MAG: DNA polymerase III subunit alpha, partial [Xanthobacteraceae bacterium]
GTELRKAYDTEPQAQQVVDVARGLEGIVRNNSIHAAAVVIADRPLTEIVPLQLAEDRGVVEVVEGETGNGGKPERVYKTVTQYSMKPIEEIGLLKMDFLGLRNLDVIEDALDIVERSTGGRPDMTTLPLDDAKTYEMLARGETVGIFQVESQGMRRALVDMRPDRFEDLIVLVALYRPGPMANIPSYCARKLGLEQIHYPHPKLEPILAPTYGIITYQEQVQQIARDLAGYSLGKADVLRRAMGKKDKKEMASQRGDFIAGAVERGIGRADAQVIFDACAKFAEYGFNKSHSAPYALLTYQTAYLKANYPVEFLAASMTLDMSNTDKLSEFRAEAERVGIKVVPPSVNRSGVAFDVDGDAIHYALAALKGVGAQAVESIVEARAERPFTDLADFAGRINPRAVNKRVLESLAASGAFDTLEQNRARAFASVDCMLAAAQRAQDAVTSGQSELFGGPSMQAPLVLPSAEPWPPAERLQKEFDAIGFFLSGHPLDDYAAALKRLRVQSWAEFARSVKAGAGAGRVAGSIVSRTERRTRTGSKMGIIGLSDPSGHYEAVLFAEGLAQFRDQLEPGKAVLLTLSAEVQGDDVRARIQSVEPLDDAAAKMQKGLRVFVRDERPIDGVAKRLEPINGGPARQERADGEVSMVLMLGEGAEVEVKLPGRFKISPQIAGAIKAVPGVVEVHTF